MDDDDDTHGVGWAFVQVASCFLCFARNGTVSCHVGSWFREVLLHSTRTSPSWRVVVAMLTSKTYPVEALEKSNSSFIATEQWIFIVKLDPCIDLAKLVIEETDRRWR